MTKETIIEGINPPSPNVAFSGATITTAQIPVGDNRDHVLAHMTTLHFVLGPNTSDRWQYRTNTNSNGAAGYAENRADHHPTNHTADRSNYWSADATANDDSRADDDRANQ